jgi:hypothetical protein
MEVTGESGTTGIRRGFPNLAVVDKAIHTLHKSLSRPELEALPELTPDDFPSLYNQDLVIAVQRMASSILRHLRLPIGSVLVSFRNMENPGRVELGPDQTCIIELNSRYQDDYRDISAVLAHEVAHVYLHKKGVYFPNELENELLTDTTAAYLGFGWPCLNAFRISVSEREIQGFGGERVVETTRSEEALGYLTPEEFGYVIAKRSLDFGVSAGKYILGKDARAAFRKGKRKARAKYSVAPLSGAGLMARTVYSYRRNRAVRMKNRADSAPQYPTYSFQPGDKTVVVLACPVCSQKVRLPVKIRAAVNCPICRKSFECRT